MAGFDKFLRIEWLSKQTPFSYEEIEFCLKKYNLTDDAMLVACYAAARFATSPREVLRGWEQPAGAPDG